MNALESNFLLAFGLTPRLNAFTKVLSLHRPSPVSCSGVKFLG